ncbi:MAG: Rieske 2Fe-2S domain-containing protein [Henriciella sp.]|nr:Rieske 2Fe-2S domain-containing protein [Henriciella sp.]
MRQEENEFLTQTGPGTPMGELMRQYWFPAMRSDELVADGDPVRLRLLCEDFVAFRTGSGEVGIVDHFCAHRCASLFFGRNEDEGIRCVYHGWKFDRHGKCVDRPSEPHEAIPASIRLKALKTREVNGLVWVYMGTRETPPPFPEFDVNRRSEESCDVSIALRECNWLQALEGDIDTAHVGFLHLGGVSADNFEKGSINYYRHLDLAPRYEIVETRYGTMYDAYRPAGESETYHRVGQFMLPFFTMTPPFDFDSGATHLRAWVPADDHHTWLIEIKSGDVTLTKDKDGKPLSGGTVGWTYLPNTTDWLGRWRIAENKSNDYGMDRSRPNYTGINGIPLQDQAITESMGPIQDRTREHLGSSDRMIMLSRRRMMKAAKALAEEGAAPPGVETPEVYQSIRSGFMLTPNEADWLAVINDYRAGWNDGAPPITR